MLNIKLKVYLYETFGLSLQHQILNSCFIMAKKVIKLSNFPVNTENPFLKEAVQEVDKYVVHKWKNTAGSDKKAVLVVSDPDTGEIMGQTTFMRQIEVDEDQFAKVYLQHFNQFFDLSTPGIRVFGYIMTCMKPTKDMIIFDLEECMKYTNYSSKAMIYRGLAELLDGGIIARGRNENFYFINPLIIWNGNRARFVTEYVKKSRKKKPADDPNQLKLDFHEDADAEELPFPGGTMPEGTPETDDPEANGVGLDGHPWK